MTVAARDACIYTIKTGGHTPKYRFSLGSQPCGLQRMDKDIVVGCMDHTLSCYTIKVRGSLKVIVKVRGVTQGHYQGQGGGSRSGVGREGGGASEKIIQWQWRRGDMVVVYHVGFI